MIAFDCVLPKKLRNSAMHGKAYFYTGPNLQNQKENMAISEFFAELYHAIAALVGPFLPFGIENAEGQLKKKNMLHQDLCQQFSKYNFI